MTRAAAAVGAPPRAALMLKRARSPSTMIHLGVVAVLLLCAGSDGAGGGALRETKKIGGRAWSGARRGEGAAGGGCTAWMCGAGAGEPADYVRALAASLPAVDVDSREDADAESATTRRRLGCWKDGGCRPGEAGTERAGGSVTDGDSSVTGVDGDMSATKASLVTRAGRRGGAGGQGEAQGHDDGTVYINIRMMISYVYTYIYYMYMYRDRYGYRYSRRAEGSTGPR